MARAAANLPEDIAGTLALRDNAHCVFFEAGRPGCAIHDVKPVSCAHFPFVCLFDGRGVHVVLSHYCPTSTSLLFEHRGPIEIVEGPSPIADLNMLEGLDAREALPPVSPQNLKTSEPQNLTPVATPRLMSFEELSAWERDQVGRAKIDELQSGDVAAVRSGASGGSGAAVVAGSADASRVDLVFSGRAVVAAVR